MLDSRYSRVQYLVVLFYCRYLLGTQRTIGSIRHNEEFVAVGIVYLQHITCKLVHLTLGYLYYLFSRFLDGIDNRFSFGGIVYRIGADDD